MIVPPGQRKFKLRKVKDKEYLGQDLYICDELLNQKKNCGCSEGWLYVAYGFEEGKYAVYKFPCACTISGGKEWWMLDRPDLFKNMVPDYYATPKELPGYVFLHPSHSHKFDKLLKRLGQIRHRQEQEKTGEVPF